MSIHMLMMTYCTFSPKYLLTQKSFVRFPIYIEIGKYDKFSVTLRGLRIELKIKKLKTEKEK